MAPKVHMATQGAFRRHHTQQESMAMIRIKTRKAIRLNLPNSARKDGLFCSNTRPPRLHRHQKHEGVQTHDAAASDPHYAGANAKPTAPGSDEDRILIKEERLSSADEDAAAADILRALYFGGILTKSAPSSPESQSAIEDIGEVDGLPNHSIIRGSSLAPSEVLLPCMQQTDFILNSWHAEAQEDEEKEEESVQDNNSAINSNNNGSTCGRSCSPRSNGSGDDNTLCARDNEAADVDMDTESYIMTTPELSPSLSHSPCSLSSSLSSECLSQVDPLSPVTPRLCIPSPPSGLQPAYAEWNSNNCSPNENRRPALVVPHHDQTSYFPPFHYGRQRSTSPSGMISPPQSPVYINRLNEPCYLNANSPLSPPEGYYGFPVQKQPYADAVSTTIITLPPRPAMEMSRVEPLTPVSPLTQAKSSPQLEKKSKSSTASSGKKPRLPRPHCNVKYETAELDFIMYQRTTKNRAWDDVTAAFNAALPRLRQYAEMDYMNLGSGDATAAAMDRYRPRPERTTPGLQASYYRQRLALPLLDENGQLVFDPQTNKQMFTEVMVRDDKSRKQQRTRRLSSISAVTGKQPNCTSTSPDDARVHLVLYFPERVSHYDYWFVSAEDKELARQRAYDRNMQRARRGLPPWEPGSDDPESGILIRGKD